MIRINKYIISCFVATVFALSSVALGASTTQQVLTLMMDDNDEAAVALISFLKSAGIDARRYSSDMVRVSYQGGRFMIRPRVNKYSLDRLVIYKIYNVDQAYIGDPGVVRMAVRLNQDYNLGIFSVTDSGRTFMLQTHITFIDHISEQEITHFMKWLNGGMRAVIRDTKDFTRYLR